MHSVFRIFRAESTFSYEIVYRNNSIIQVSDVNQNSLGWK